MNRNHIPRIFLWAAIFVTFLAVIISSSSAPRNLSVSDVGISEKPKIESGYAQDDKTSVAKPFVALQNADEGDNERVLALTSLSDSYVATV